MRPVARFCLGNSVNRRLSSELSRECACECTEKDGGAGNTGAGGSGSGNCDFKVLVAAVPYGSVANSSTTVRTAAVPAHA